MNTFSSIVGALPLHKARARRNGYYGVYAILAVLIIIALDKLGYKNAEGLWLGLNLIGYGIAEYIAGMDFRKNLDAFIAEGNSAIAETRKQNPQYPEDQLQRASRWYQRKAFMSHPVFYIPAAIIAFGVGAVLTYYSLLAIFS
ncbi:MAG: hypothetical protein WCJ29_03105 [bacterium]